MVQPPLYDHHFFSADPNSEPIFVVGMGRSGTTMLRLMLHRHSRVAMLSETWFGTRVWDRRWGFPMRCPIEPFRSQLLDSFIRLLNDKGRSDFPLDFRAYRRRVLEGPVSLSRFLSELGAVWSEQEGKPEWGEKTPLHVFYLNVLVKMFPSMRAIHIVRDPRDVASSLMEAPFTPVGDPVSFAFEWNRTIRAADESKGEGVRIVTIRYEDLVRYPEATLQRICKSLGLAFESDMLAFHEVAGSYAPKQSWMKGVGQPLNESSVGRWRGNIGKGDVALIEAITKDGMTTFGYERVTGALSLRKVGRIARRLERAWGNLEDADARRSADHVAMHRGSYRDMLINIVGDKDIVGDG